MAKKNQLRKFLRPYEIIILIGASLHLLILLIEGIRAKDFSGLGVVKVLDLHLLFPGIPDSLNSPLLSFVIYAVTYIGLYLYLTRKS